MGASWTMTRRCSSEAAHRLSRGARRSAPPLNGGSAVIDRDTPNARDGDRAAIGRCIAGVIRARARA